VSAARSGSTLAPPTRAPQSSAGTSRLRLLGKQSGRVLAAVAAEEVDGRRAAADELPVDVEVALPDVAEHPPETVGPVEAPVRLESYACPRRRETAELGGRRARVALALAELGGVDLDEAYPVARRDAQRVAVGDGGHPRQRGAAAAGDRGHQQERPEHE
jgi:hypothetical protein